MPNVQELAAPVKLLLMDVDGVLTDGRLINVPDVAGNMVETKAFDIWPASGRHEKVLGPRLTGVVGCYHDSTRLLPDGRRSAPHESDAFSREHALKDRRRFGGG